jgi:hypothetical protein
MCFVERETANRDAGPFLMTTRHNDEPLEEALWFFKMLAIPEENYVLAELERYAVAVGNSEWAMEMGRKLGADASEEALGP